MVPPREEELAAAVAEILDDPALRRSMGDAARERAGRRFDWSEKARRWEILLTEDVGADVHEGPSPLHGPVASPLDATPAAPIFPGHADP